MFIKQRPLPNENLTVHTVSTLIKVNKNKERTVYSEHLAEGKSTFRKVDTSKDNAWV